MLQPPDCDPALGECGSWVVYPYFISFVLIVSIIMLNLFTAVILESFEAQQEQDVSDALVGSSWHCAAFAWPALVAAKSG